MRLRTFGGLWIDDLGAEAESPRPRALALLAMLACAAGKGVSRDRVLSVLWPESETDRARHALAQTLYGLRRLLGTEVVLSTPELTLDRAKISSDLEAFRSAVRDRRWSDAAELYIGPFLDGFYLSDAPEFERWAERERAALATDGVRAIEAIATEHSKSGAHDAAEHWRRLTVLDPLNARFATSYMEALAARGDRAAALAHGKTYAALLKEEFDASPDPAVERLVRQLRTALPSAANATVEAGIPVVNAETSPRTVVVGPSADGGASTAVEVQRPRGKSGPSRLATSAELKSFRTSHAVAKLLVSRRWLLLVGALAFTALGLGAAITRRSPERLRREAPILAVGRIRDLVAPESLSVSTVLSEMLATSLARIIDLQVVANSRMLEVSSAGSDTSRRATIEAARRAGATEIIEGELLPLPRNRLRLEIRRVRLRDGVLRGGYRVSGDDRIAMFDSATALVANDLRVTAPSGSLAEVSTRSPIAYRMYEEGLRALYQYDPASANRLFRAAIADDSMFAMATYYAWRSSFLLTDTAQNGLMERALRLAPRATRRDRLVMMADLLHYRNDPAAIAVAETLATDFSDDPEALVRSAAVERDLSRAVRLLERSIVLDSIAGTSQQIGAMCRLCEALRLLQERYQWVDSIDAAERALRRWTRLRPADNVPWGLLAELYLATGRAREGTAATVRYESLGGSRGPARRDELYRAIMSDEVEASLAACTRGLLAADPSMPLDYRWLCEIALRAAGRYRDARALLVEGRIPGSQVAHRSAPIDPFIDAVLDYDMRQFTTASRKFRNLYQPDRDSHQIPPGTRARETAWALALAATADVAAGDTAQARSRADTLEWVGPGSLYPRDRRLHHFIRGLLLARAGKFEDAVSEYRAAIWSPTYGYTRINLELGRALLALGRSAEGIGTVRAALHGGIDGSNLYVSRTELHDLLAQLFEAAQRPDSAVAHYTIVEHAWRGADPLLKGRYNAVVARLAALAPNVKPQEPE